MICAGAGNKEAESNHSPHCSKPEQGRACSTGQLFPSCPFIFPRLCPALFAHGTNKHWEAAALLSALNSCSQKEMFILTGLLSWQRRSPTYEGATAREAMRDVACPGGFSPAEGRYAGSLRREVGEGNRRGTFPREHL